MGYQGEVDVEVETNGVTVTDGRPTVAEYVPTFKTRQQHTFTFNGTGFGADPTKRKPKVVIEDVGGDFEWSHVRVISFTDTQVKVRALLTRQRERDSLVVTSGLTAGVLTITVTNNQTGTVSLPTATTSPAMPSPTPIYDEGSDEI